MSSSVSVPSVQLVWVCRSPLMSLELDQLRQAARLGGFDLAVVLAQLGRDPRQPEALVDGGFALALQQLAGGVVLEAERASAASRASRASASRRATWAREPVYQTRALPQASRGTIDEPHLEPAVELHADLVGAAIEHLDQVRQTGDGLPMSALGLLGVSRRGEQVEPADGVLHAADAADDRQPIGVDRLARAPRAPARTPPRRPRSGRASSAASAAPGSAAGCRRPSGRSPAPRCRRPLRAASSSSSAASRCRAPGRRARARPGPEARDLQQRRQRDRKVAPRAARATAMRPVVRYSTILASSALPTPLQLAQATLLEQRVQRARWRCRRCAPRCGRRCSGTAARP